MQDQIFANFSKVFTKGLGTPLLLIVMLAMMTLPLPPFILDILFTFNISLALVVLLAGIYSRRPLDFSAFPTVLLLATLLRLALNIASTRVVLLNGHHGTAAAGQVIQAFGEVVVGGNYAVGFSVFVILIVINFVVVTKGAGRISEVSARFTLDAMPGKQMGIDADLNSGLINQEEAKRRRKEVEQEADFYGSMDGASKFVRGDAIAGILILLVNIIGGIAIGMLQQDMSFADAVHNYGLLTIGDGLVAQIPSLLLSVSAAIMVTRVSEEHDMGQQVITELFDNPKVLGITSGILISLGITPGMPHVSFLLLGGSAGAWAWHVYQKGSNKELQPVSDEVKPEETNPATRDLSWDDVSPVDVIGLEIGYRLIPMVDTAQGGELMARIKGVRKKLSQELGFLVPAVHIRDNLDISPNAYRVTLMGVVVGETDVYLDRLMAINPGQVVSPIDGVKTKDPAFGLDAVWIANEQKDYAQSMGYTVVDTSTVIATHLSHLLQKNASKLFGHEEMSQMLTMLQKISPKLYETINELPMGSLVRVMQNCLAESIPLRDFRSIAEAVAEASTKSKDPDFLTNAVRSVLSSMIFQSINGQHDELPVITLDPDLERILQKSVQGAGDGAASIEPNLAEKLGSAVKQAADKQEALGEPTVLLVPAVLRALLSRFLRASIQSLHVLSYHEIPDDKQIRVVATVGR